MSIVSEVSKIGDKLVMQAKAPAGESVVVFEDDGDTGYFYALARNAAGEMELLDALHIYNAEADLRGTDVRLELAWSEDGERAGLRVNAALWALFDFPRQTGWSRSNFPPPPGLWRMDGERPSWDDALIKAL
jgi:hypothetical protein